MTFASSLPSSTATRSRPASCSLALLLVLIGAAGCDPPPQVGEESAVTLWGGDMLAVGRAPVVTGRVPGDVILAGGAISFAGEAEGDYLGAGGSQVVDGRVDGNARAAGGEIEMRGEVGRNVTIAGGRVHLNELSRVGGNAYLAGGLVIVDGAIERHLRAVGDEIVIDGFVDGSVAIESRRFRLGPSARIDGELRYRVPEEGVSINPAAQIGGEIAAFEARTPQVPHLGWMLRGFWILGFLLTGTVFALLFPRLALGSARSLQRRPGAAAGLGLLWVVGFPLAIGAALLTIVGLPLALILMASFLISLYLARLVPALWIGHRILGTRVGEGRAGAVAGFLLGGLILLVVELTPLLGALAFVAATLLGLGAFVVALHAGRSMMDERERSPAGGESRAST